MHTYDNHLQAAFRSLLHRLTCEPDVFTDVNRSLRYDRIEELPEHDAAAHRRLVCGKKGERSNSEGDRSNFEGDRGKNARAGAASAVSPAKS